LMWGTLECHPLCLLFSAFQTLRVVCVLCPLLMWKCSRTFNKIQEKI
jgi:hypothetical protein